MIRLIIVVALLLAGCNAPDIGKIPDLKDVKLTYPPPRYQLIPAAANNAWKIDTQNGDTWFCSLGPQRAVCIRATME